MFQDTPKMAYALCWEKTLQARFLEETQYFEGSNTFIGICEGSPELEADKETGQAVDETGQAVSVRSGNLPGRRL